MYNSTRARHYYYNLVAGSQILMQQRIRARIWPSHVVDLMSLASLVLTLNKMDYGSINSKSTWYIIRRTPEIQGLPRIRIKPHYILK